VAALSASARPFNVTRNFEMSSFEEKYFRSRDGLALYYRDYPGDPHKVPVLCLPGLTRNSRDFERSAAHIAPTRRVICTDQRGRGRSQYDPNWLNYHPGMYVDDMWVLLRELNVSRVIVIGTSLGGIMAMVMASMRPQQLAGVVLNDVGPELEIIGSQRIQSYVGRAQEVGSWDEATRSAKEMFGSVYPDLTEERWQEFAHNTFREDADGKIRLDYDPRIADLLRLLPFGAMPPMWYAYAALYSIPTLAIRGELSDLLSARVFERMQREKPDLVRLTVPNRGHAPMLHEPICQDAIDSFLSRLP
jgi:pimeloyl-ACP methyl ester carboxylesterase